MPSVDKEPAKQISNALAQLKKPYCCHGSVNVSSVSVCCSDPDNAALSAFLFKFPVPDMQHLQQLESFCIPATFGKGKEVSWMLYILTKLHMDWLA